MGIISEIDMMNRDAEDDAFEVSSDRETVDSFSEEFEPIDPPKQEPQAEDAEEARKKAEFDAAEAKRKAEWEAKQAQKKLREQQELDRLAAMSDDDVMQASMNRVSQDTERLTRRNMKLCVMEDVQTECLADPAFARLVMNPKKKMVNCFHYINRKAWEYLEQEMRDNGEKPMGGGFGGCTINLVRAEAYDGYLAEATDRFAHRFGHAPRVIEVNISQGARRIG